MFASFMRQLILKTEFLNRGLSVALKTDSLMGLAAREDVSAIPMTTKKLLEAQTPCSSRLPGMNRLDSQMSV